MLLQEAGIVRSSFGEKYTVYSLRHFYAVNALRNGAFGDSSMKEGAQVTLSVGKKSANVFPSGCARTCCRSW